MDDDVLVVGAGLGGCLAAITIARERPGLSVRLLQVETDRFDYHSGLIDVLGYRASGPDGSPNQPSEPMTSPFVGISALPERHPYTRLGAKTLREGIEAFDAAVDDRYCGDQSTRNALFIGPQGRPTPAYRYPASMEAGSLGAEASMLLVGIREVPDVDVDFVADRLADRVSVDMSATTLDLPAPITDYPATARIAELFDAAVGRQLSSPDDGQDDDLEDDQDALALTDFLAEIRSELDIEPRVGLPAVLGQCDNRSVQRELEGRLAARVFEIPTGPPSVPGRRLEARLLSAANDAGVAIETDCSPTGVETGNGRVESIETDSGRFSATEFVLATGDVGVGGIVTDASEAHEPLFDCHVPSPADRTDWFAAEFLGDHAFARFGVEVDEQFQPLDANGELEYSNLSAVGSVIGGIDLDAEQSRDGVAIGTGYAVGTRLADEL